MHISTWRIAWRSLGRNKRRTLLAISAVAVGQFALIATTSIMHGYADNIRLALTGPMIGHIQVHAPHWRDERAIELSISSIENVLENIRRDPDVRNACARIYAPVLIAPESDAFAGMIVGVDIGEESKAYGLLSGMQGKLKDNEVLIGYRLARKTGLHTGQEIALIGQAIDGSLANNLYTVHDIIRSPADLINQMGIVMSLKNAQEFLYMPGQAHEIIIHTRQSGQAEAVQKRLKQNPVLSSLDIKTWKEIAPEFVVILKMSDYVGYFVLLLVFIAAVSGIANTLMMSTFERLHEFGMLLALGARPRRIVHLIMVEAFLLSISGIIVGTATGYGFAAFFSERGIDLASWGGEQAKAVAYRGLNLPLLIYPRMELYDVFIGLIALSITALIAAAWPASIAGKLEPMEAMRS